MTQATKPQSLFETPVMSAEGEQGVELPVAPIRVSGMISLVLGIVSFVAILGAPLIVLPILGVLTALYALRPYTGERPVGLTAAWIGLFLAMMFGVWGFTERQLRSHKMESEAVRFASEWLKLVGQGDLELALEMQLPPSRRQPETMPLADYYRQNEAALELIESFKKQDLVPALITLGTKPKWELAQPPKVYTLYGRELTRTVWRDTTHSHESLVKVEMEYIGNFRPDRAFWKVDLVSTHIDDSNRL